MMVWKVCKPVMAPLAFASGGHSEGWGTGCRKEGL